MQTAYDQVPYRGSPFPQTHPDRLATLAILYGVEPADVRRCRVLELGCADGGNLVPMASEFPESEFLGIDLAPGGIELGRVTADGLGLRNLRLKQMDILDATSELGSFDYIIAHGLYSWVPEPVREKLLAIAAAHLAPHGIAYISYNVLPGCHVREVYRDLLLFHTRGLAEPAARIESARQFLGAAVETQQPPWKTTAQSLLDKPPVVLFHDEMGAIYHPVLFHDFVSRAAAHGLQFLSEANFVDMRPRDVPEPAVALSDQWAAGDRIARQQYWDFFRNRAFRQTLLCRAEIDVPEEPLAERVPKLYAASQARPTSAEPDLGLGIPEEFRGERGASLTTVHPVVKAAMIVLGNAWPEALSFDDLSGAAGALAGEAADREGVAAMLLALYGSGLVELQSTRRRSISRVSRFPTTTALARWQASRGEQITTPRHGVVEAAGDVERRLFALLDGTRDLSMLARELAPAVNQPESVVAREVATTLDKLARLGLLIA